jgi:L-lactate dehydrogenase
MVNNKIGIIGMGWVGTSVAISILERGLCKQLLVSDVRNDIAEGEAMDLSHGSSFFHSAETKACDIKDMIDCDMIVITAGRGGTADESRLDLLKDNIRIARSISDSLKGFAGLLIVVANPVDVLTYYYQKFTGLPVERVIGTGTMLDTARLREVIGRKVAVDPKSIHANVIGEHGDSEVVLWSSATIGGLPLVQWQNWQEDYQSEIAKQVRTAAQEIIKRKGATNHAIGLVTATLLKWLLRGDRRVTTVSMVVNDYCGLNEVALSVPVLIGENGIERMVPLNMSEYENRQLVNSAEVLKKAIQSVRDVV